MAAVHLSADLTLSILHRKSAFRIGHVNDKDNHYKRDNNKQSKDEIAVCPGGRDHGREGSGDIYKKDNGNTVADSVVIYLFGEPHDDGSTGAIAGNDNELMEQVIVAFNDPMRGIQECAITDTG